jgi:hypothetical protein
VEFRRLMVEQATRIAGDPAIGSGLGIPVANQSDLRAFEGMLPKGADWKPFDSAQAQQLAREEIRSFPKAAEQVAP